MTTHTTTDAIDHAMNAGAPQPLGDLPPSLFTGEALRARYLEVKQRIAAAAQRAGTSPDSVVLVVVTKYAGLDQVRELMQLGHRDFGENQVQQLIQRAASVDEWLARQRLGVTRAPAPSPVRWHMIGHLQRNKARKAADLCRLIHSVDSLRLAEELQAVGLKTDRVIDILLQVNSSGEESKFGCAPAAAGRLAEEIMTMANVRIRGMMTMAAPNTTPALTRATFARTRELFDDMVKSGIAGHPRVFNILSMGMSGDYELALAEGANMVRVGSAIVGDARPSPGEDAEHD